MRKLVTIKKIDKLIPIPKKDRIVLAVIGGWSVIVKKDEFVVNDLCVFFEIDSFLPVADMYEFLGKPTTHQDKLGHRLRTMKMSGAVSQGLALPLNMLFGKPEDVTEGSDWTEEFGVIKFDIDLTQQGKGGGLQVTGQPKSKFPSFLRKTDQERIQNLPHYFEVHKNTLFEETLKLDGSSMTCYKIDNDIPFWKGWINMLAVLVGYKDITEPDVFPFNHFGVCSRNLELKRPGSEDKKSNFWTAATNAELERDLPTGYAVQGEVLATNIQANYEKVDSVEFHIFSVFNIETQEYLNPTDASAFVKKYLPDATHIPIVDTLPIFDTCKDFDSLQERVTGPSINSDVKSEGRVYKSLEGTITFKCVSNAYLLQKSK